MQAADGTGSATRLTESANQQDPTGITADGTRVVFYELTPTRQRDLRLLTLTPTPRVEPLLETPLTSAAGSCRPTAAGWPTNPTARGGLRSTCGRFRMWATGQWQVSTAGGVQPLWARSGRELFYVAPDGALLTVPVEPRGTTWSAGTATKLVEGRYYTGGGNVSTRRSTTCRPTASGS